MIDGKKMEASLQLKILSVHLEGLIEVHLLMREDALAEAVYYRDHGNAVMYILKQEEETYPPRSFPANTTSRDVANIPLQLHTLIHSNFFGRTVSSKRVARPDGIWK
jgi:hypothetical protein